MVVNEIPQVPGAEKPYIVPGIDPPTEAEKQSAKAKSALPKHPPIMDETTADQSNKEQKSDPAPAKTD